jgi:hypothetical protein
LRNFLAYKLAVFYLPKKLSVGALSQQFRFLLIYEHIPQVFMGFWNSLLQYSVDSIGYCSYAIAVFQVL